MADIIIVTILALAVFFVVRSQLQKLCGGRCGAGGSGCPGECAECFAGGEGRRERDELSGDKD